MVRKKQTEKTKAETKNRNKQKKTKAGKEANIMKKLIMFLEEYFEICAHK